MSPVTHFLTGWVFASAFKITRAERIAITAASVSPDVDGLGIIPELLTRHSAHPLPWFSEYHHSLHTLVFALVVTLAVFLTTRSWRGAILAFCSFHIHLLEDLAGSRGPDGEQWPIPYLSPLSSRAQWVWHGEWQLNGWQNYAITVLLLGVVVWFFHSRSRSPVEVFSTRADRSVVATIHQWIRRLQTRSDSSTAR